MIIERTFRDVVEHVVGVLHAQDAIGELGLALVVRESGLLAR